MQTKTKYINNFSTINAFTMHVALETTTVFRLRVFVCCSVFVH